MNEDIQPSQTLENIINTRDIISQEERKLTFNPEPNNMTGVAKSETGINSMIERLQSSDGLEPIEETNNSERS
jgi:hypothetical protein